MCVAVFAEGVTLRALGRGSELHVLGIGPQYAQANESGKGTVYSLWS